MQQLSLSARPKTLNALIGQKQLVKRIRGHMKSSRIVNAWMFHGPRGCGKTTLARILATALQCSHRGVEFGQCRECYDNFESFDITEIPAAKLGTKQEMREQLEGADWAPRWGRYRIYIIDECQNMSSAAQALALKYLEDSVDSTIFILCTTDPGKIIETLQSRCTGTYKVAVLREEGILRLVTILLKRVKSDKPADRLAEQLYERGINIPRLICHAVEKYVSGGTVEESSEIEAASAVDVSALTRSVTRGDWDGARNFLYKSQVSDADPIRLGTMAYLRGMLLHESESGIERGDAVADALLSLVALKDTSGIAMSSAIAATLYKVCAVFQRYKRG